jgi:hypothetical protein
MDWNTKSSMMKPLFRDVFEAGLQYCKTFEGSTCPYMVAFRRIINCAQKFPQFKDIQNRQNFIKDESPVRTVPTRMIAKTIITEKGVQETIKVQEAVDVSVFFQVVGISQFNDEATSYQLEYIMIAYWKTSAEQCNEHIKRLCAQNLDFSTRPQRLSSQNFDLVWIPDLFIPNAESQDNVVDQFDTTTRNEVKYIMVSQVPNPDYDKDKDLNSTLTTLCGMKMVVKGIAAMSCTMQLNEYPADVQKCPVYIRSFRYDHKLFKLRFEGEGASVVPEGLRLPEHEFAYGKKEINMIVLGEVYQALQINLYFKRIIWGKVVTIFIPTAIQTITCFLTFYQGLDTTSDRMCIAITCLLGLMSAFIEIRGGLPSSSNVRKTDVWMITMILFVVCQSIEAVLVDFVTIKRRNEHEKRQELDWKTETLHKVWPQRRRRNILYDIVSDSMNRGNFTRQDLSRINIGVSQHKRNKSNYFVRLGKFIVKKPLKNAGVSRTSPERDPLLIDSISGIIFPLAFGIFVLYFFTNLTGTSIPDDAIIVVIDT